jgi:hypothetical protein
MRAWLAALILMLGASAALAQMAVPFGGAYEPTPAFLPPANTNLNNCNSAPLPYPYNRDVRRGGQPSDAQAASGSNCPAR